MFGIVYCAHQSVPRGQSGVYPVNKGDPFGRPLESARRARRAGRACVQKQWRFCGAQVSVTLSGPWWVSSGSGTIHVQSGPSCTYMYMYMYNYVVGVHVPVGLRANLKRNQGEQQGWTK